MTLFQALKTKNRLAGELVKLNEVLERENSRRNDNPSNVDCNMVWGQIIEKSDKLGQIKAAIAKANINIYDKIERMAELKSRISFINDLGKREGPEIVLVGRDNEKLEYSWNSFINQERADDLIHSLQEQINTLQDEVDLFNAKTEINFE